jgi:hypothetical protein
MVYDHHHQRIREGLLLSPHFPLNIEITISRLFLVAIRNHTFGLHRELILMVCIGGTHGKMNTFQFIY